MKPDVFLMMVEQRAHAAGDPYKFIVFSPEEMVQFQQLTSRDPMIPDGQKGMVAKTALTLVTFARQILAADVAKKLSS